jgi:hypothetical protein
MRGRDHAWYQVGATSHTGYPQPEVGYAAVTYDASGYCPRCGIGAVQRRPFRFRADPKTSRRRFIQLNWVFDELFVPPDVFTTLEREGITGIGVGPVLDHRTSQPLQSVQQLLVLTILPPALIADGLKIVTCRPNNEEPPLPVGLHGSPRHPEDTPFCGRAKYHMPSRLRLRRNAFAEVPDVVKSHEWFGSGGRAFRALLVTDAVMRLVQALQWRGLWFEPVELAD